MPYADPERQREAVKVWQQAHPEKLKAYCASGMSLYSAPPLWLFCNVSISAPHCLMLRTAHRCFCAKLRQ